MKRAPIRNDLTAEFVRSLLGYDGETGIFIWKKRSGPLIVGSRAGYLRKDGYREIMIKGHSYLEHRLAWLILHGEWPVLDVDHKDTNKSNNAAKNLRQATRSNNCFNADHRGYYFIKDRQKYRVAVTVNGRVKIVGSYDTAEEAAAARLVAVHNHYGEYSPTRRTGDA